MMRPRMPRASSHTHTNRVTCHMSHVTCHMSHVTCHMSHVTPMGGNSVGAIKRALKRQRGYGYIQLSYSYNTEHQFKLYNGGQSPRPPLVGLLLFEF
jgi:hypothetical protein